MVSSDSGLESWFTAWVALVAPGRCVGTAENPISVLILIVNHGRVSTRGVVHGSLWRFDMAWTAERRPTEPDEKLRKIRKARN